MGVMKLAHRYLSLLKKSLLDELYIENEARLVYLVLCFLNSEVPDGDTLRNIARSRPDILDNLRRSRTGERPGAGDVWHVDKAGGSMNLRNVLSFYHTMVGQQGLDNIHALLDAISADHVRGDLLEAGVWRGGATIFMRGYLAAHDIPDRRVWVADSFAGIPKPSLPQDGGLDLSADVLPVVAIPRDEVEDLFQRYDLLDDRVRFLEGWFKDTLPKAPIEQLALLRLDGDLYESTMDSLVPLYPKLSPGGFVIVDDYHDIPSCKLAVDEYRAQHGITAPMTRASVGAVYWRKP